MWPSPSRLWVLWALALAVGAVSREPALAQDPPADTMAVVDFQLILRESVAAKAIREYIEEKQRQYREQIKSKEDELRLAQEELARQRTILSPEAYAQRESDFQKRVEAVQREVADRNKELDNALGYGMQQVQ